MQFYLSILHYVCNLINNFSGSGSGSSVLSPLSTGQSSMSVSAADDTAGHNSADAVFPSTRLLPLSESDADIIVCIL